MPPENTCRRFPPDSQPPSPCRSPRPLGLGWPDCLGAAAWGLGTLSSHDPFLEHLARKSAERCCGGPGTGGVLSGSPGGPGQVWEGQTAQGRGSCVLPSPSKSGKTQCGPGMKSPWGGITPNPSSLLLMASRRPCFLFSWANRSEHHTLPPPPPQSSLCPRGLVLCPVTTEEPPSSSAKPVPALVHWTSPL